MRYITLTVIILLFWSCETSEKNNLLTGDLYFSFFRLGSYYNISDSVITKFESYMDTLNLENADNEDIELINTYKKLKEEKLIYKPFIDVLVKKDSVVKLYLDSMDYDRIKIYKRQKLQEDNKKVRIEATIRKIGKGFYYCKDLLKVELIDGETLNRQKKLKIEDYN